MADNNDKKPAGWNLDATETVIVLIFAAAFLSTGVPMILSYFTSGEISFYGIKLSGIFSFFRNHVQLLRSLGYVLAGAAALGTFVYNKRADAVSREEKAKVYPAEMKVAIETAEVKNPLVEKWKQIVKLSESQNTSDWRLAIIEADIILGDLLDKLQLPGETIGDKLKAVEESDFLTIEAAWEAHKARNMIAHEGSDYILNNREVRRIISLYESVFKEFYLI